MFWQLLVITLCVWWVYFRWERRGIYKIHNQLPKLGFKTFPFIGHAYIFGTNNEDHMNCFKILGKRAVKQGGLTGLWMANRLYVCVCDPVAAEVILKHCPDKDDTTMRLIRAFTGNGSIFAPVNIWRPRRKVLAPVFSLKNLQGFVSEFAKQATIMTELLEQEVGKSEVSMWSYFNTYTFDAITKNSLGIELKSQNTRFHPFLEGFEQLTRLMGLRVVSPWLYWDSIYELFPECKEVKYWSKVIYDFVDDLRQAEVQSAADIDERLWAQEDLSSTFAADCTRQFRFVLRAVYRRSPPAPPSPAAPLRTRPAPLSHPRPVIRLKREELAALQSRNEAVENKTFLDMLIESSSKEKGYTDLELREEVIVIVAAGSDTSAVATGYTAVMLSRYPEVQEKVYQELEDVFGHTDRPVTAADLPKLVYLEAVVKETLRLYPPVPIYVREIYNDCKLPNGTTLVNGVAVLFLLHGMHRNPKYWGEDAEQFRPERFLEGPLRHPVQFIPFSYSVRNCLGGTYALMSIKTALATMLRRYRLLPPAGLDPQRIKDPLHVTFDIMMRHVDNYNVRLEYRSK